MRGDIVKKIIVLSFFMALNLVADVDFDNAMEAYDNKNFKKSLMLLEKSCENKYAQSCRFLGFFYHKGRLENDDKFVEIDREKSLFYHNLACKYNDADSCRILGLMYRKEKKYKKAIDVLKKGCYELKGKGGRSCNILAMMIENGQGIKKDVKKAIKMYKKNCDNNIFVSCYNLALYYEENEKDKKREIFSLYKKTCDRDDKIPYSCVKVGEKYKYGNGIDTNTSQSFNYFQKACNQGESEGCYNLMEMYTWGKGVKQDLNKADEIANETCKKGYDKACRDYGSIGYEAKSAMTKLIVKMFKEKPKKTERRREVFRVDNAKNRTNFGINMDILEKFFRIQVLKSAKAFPIRSGLKQYTAGDGKHLPEFAFNIEAIQKKGDIFLKLTAIDPLNNQIAWREEEKLGINTSVYIKVNQAKEKADYEEFLQAYSLLKKAKKMGLHRTDYEHTKSYIQKKESAYNAKLEHQRREREYQARLQREKEQKRRNDDEKAAAALIGVAIAGGLIVEGTKFLFGLGEYAAPSSGSSSGSSSYGASGYSGSSSSSERSTKSKPLGVAKMYRDGRYTIIICRDGRKKKVYHNDNGKCTIPSAFGSYECNWSVKETAKECNH